MFRKADKFRNIPTHSRHVERDLNRIFLNKLNYYYFATDFIKNVLDAKRQEFKDFILDFSHEDPEEKAVYPNIIVPITAFMDNLIQDEDCSFRIENDIKNIASTNILNPASAHQLESFPTVLNKVWRFDSPEDITLLVSAYIDAIYKEDEFESKDFLVWLEWCLNEVMDNVIIHSEAKSGFVMGQVHASNKTIAFCIADAGRGIYKSFIDSSIKWPKDERDALEMALREGVTRDPGVGQGNGLWGLHEVSMKTNGRLRLASGGSLLNVDERASFSYYPYLNSRRGGTVIDFTFDYSKPVDLKDILGGHQPESIKVLQAQDDNQKYIKYRLAEQKSGFGTRRSGEKIRHEVNNLLLEGQPIEVDFSDINIISSSFADEFLGKLYVTIGPLQFSQYIRIVHENSTITAIINKAIMQRVNATFNAVNE